MNRVRVKERAEGVRRLGLVFCAALALMAAGTSVAGVPAAGAALPALRTGFDDDPVLVSASPRTTAHWLGRAANEGAGLVRVNVVWSAVAPVRRPLGFVASSPGSRGYRWAATDRAVRDIASHGMRAVLLPYLAPSWAQGAHRPGGVRPGAWKPNAAQFGAFGRALAIRYSGHYPDPAHRGHFLPHVRYYQAWNEPNLGYDISPAWKRVGTHWVPESPSIYRPMLNAFYSAIKGVSRSDFVLAGGTAPYGDGGPVGRTPNLWRVRPLAFDRSLFCLNRRLKKACRAAVHLDAVDDHPYVFGPPTMRPYYPDDLNISDMYKLRRAVKAAERAGTVLPHGSKQVWAGEISWATNPPRRSHIAVSPARQAAYLEKGMYLLWRQHMSVVLWLDIRDKPSSITVYNPFNYNGLYFHSGRPKPATVAFRFPFITHRVSGRTIQAWGRAPGRGTLRIERKRGRKWVAVARFHVSRHQVFLKKLRARGRQEFRAQIGHATSLVWSQSG